MNPEHYRSGHLWVAKCTRGADGSWILPNEFNGKLSPSETQDGGQTDTIKGEHKSSGWRVRWVCLRGERGELAICNHRKLKARDVLDLSQDGCYIGELTDEETQILRAGERVRAAVRPVIRAAKGLFQSASRYRLLNDEHLAPFPFKVTAWSRKQAALSTHYFSARTADAKLQWLAVIQAVICSSTQALMESMALRTPPIVAVPSHLAGSPPGMPLLPHPADITDDPRANSGRRDDDLSSSRASGIIIVGHCLPSPDAADSACAAAEARLDMDDHGGPCREEAWGDPGGSLPGDDPDDPNLHEGMYGLECSTHGGYSTPRGGQDDPPGFSTPQRPRLVRTPSGPSSSPTPRSVSPSASSAGGDDEEHSCRSFLGGSTDTSCGITFQHKRAPVGPPQEHLPVVRLVHGVRVLEEGFARGVLRLRASTVVHCRADALFRVIADTDALPLIDPAIQHCRVVEEVDAHTRVLHVTYHAPGAAASLAASAPSLVQRCMAMAPASCLLPRDLCVARTWRQDPEGAYLCVFESISHRDCPRLPGYVRASVTNGMYAVMPPAGASSAALSLLQVHLELDPGYSPASVAYLQTCGLLAPWLDVHVAHVGALRAAAEASLFHPQGEIEMERSALQEQLQLVVSNATRGKERQPLAATGARHSIDSATEASRPAPAAHAVAPVVPPVKLAPRVERPAHFSGSGILLRAASASIAMLASGVAHVSSPHVAVPAGTRAAPGGDSGGSNAEELARVGKGNKRGAGGMRAGAAKPSTLSQKPLLVTDERERAWAGGGDGEGTATEDAGSRARQVVEEAAEEERLWEWASSFGTVPRTYWAPVTDPGGVLKVRGKTYLKDKVKVVSGHPIMQAWAVDLFLTDAPLTHVAERADSALMKMRAAAAAAAQGEGTVGISSTQPWSGGTAVRGSQTQASEMPPSVPEEAGEDVADHLRLDGHQDGWWEGERGQNGAGPGPEPGSPGARANGTHAKPPASAHQASGGSATARQPPTSSSPPRAKDGACKFRPSSGSFRKGSAAWRSLQALRSGYVLMINAVFPAPGGRCYNLVIYACPWRDGGWVTLDELATRREPHLRLLRRTLEPKAGVERARLLKKIVYIHSGPAVVLWTFGRMLVAMSKKLGQLDFAIGDGYLEADLDLRKGCLSSALNKVGVPYMPVCVFDLVVVLEGQSEDELPENIMGGIKLIKINFAEQAKELPG
eukprot:jgi/Mesvir1/13569/Mv26561-RA.1